MSDYKNVLDNLYNGVYFTDSARRITYWNKGAERITGYKSDEVVGKKCADNILMHINAEGTNMCKGNCPLAHTLMDGEMHETEAYLHHKNGHRVPVLIRVTPLQDEKGKVTGAVEIFSDNSSMLALRDKVKELQALALLDELTELGNRRYAEISLATKLDEMKRYKLNFGMLFIDIDFFKKINDSYGHPVGDRVLHMVARTMDANTRPSDIITRWSGDEFVAILANVDEKLLYNIASKFRTLVERSSFTEGKDVINVTISIGATIAQPNDTIDTLIKRADELNYASKKAGRNRITMFQPVI